MRRKGFQENIVKRCPKADVREALSVIDDGGKSLGEILQSWMAGTESGFFRQCNNKRCLNGHLFFSAKI